MAAQTPLPLVVDTDGGVDDAAALWWCLTDPRLDVVAVTTVFGVVPAAGAAENVCKVLAAAGRSDIPVAVGTDEPLGPAPALRRATFIHGDDGLGDTGIPAAAFGPGPTPAGEMLAHVVDTRAGEVAILTLGPLTNLARRLGEDPSWASRVRSLTVMGGAVRAQGNAQPVAEANIAHDPQAAAVVAAAHWSQPPLLVTLDATLVATLGEAEFALAGHHRTPAASFLAEPLAFYRRFGSTFNEGGECPCHDLLAAMAVADPAIVHSELLPLGVDTGRSLAWGMTVADRRQPFFARNGQAQASPEGLRPWHVGVGADAGRFRANVRRLFGD